MSDLLPAMAQRLRAERIKLGLTQGQCAKLADVSRRSQAGYEAGSRPFDGPYLGALARAGVDVTYVVTGERGSFDWTIHDKVLKAIEEWIEEAQVEMAFEDKMTLLRAMMRKLYSTRAKDLSINDLLKGQAA
jgi:transcriptional regulator with XRE-family HTH domain